MGWGNRDGDPWGIDGEALGCLCLLILVVLAIAYAGGQLLVMLRMPVG